MTELFGMPLPRNVRVANSAVLPLPGRFVLAAGADLGDRVPAAMTRLNKLLSGDADAEPMSLTLRTQGLAAQLSTDTREGYRLIIEPAGVTLEADTDVGLLHGIQTLQQTLVAQEGLPVCEIEDQPRFPWRGLMLDVARHFLSVATLRRTLDCMAAAKLNVLHLHLTDDQAFRFRSAQYPRLASNPSYSARDLSELVRYADGLGIRVIPELDMPGHVTSWLLAYPEWGTQSATPSDRFGVHHACLNPVDDAVHQAIDQLVAELADIFPDAYLHIGGDEVHPAWWRESAQLQAHMQAHDLADVQALQAQFNLRVRETLVRHERQMLVWDEALHPDLAAHAKSVVVQNWRGATTRNRALAAGHGCVVSAGYYLDLHYPAHWHYRFDPEAPQTALMALEDELLDLPEYAHVAEGMRWTHQWREGAVDDGVSSAQVLGGEACMWSELVDDGTIDTRVWTRLPAIAERLWSDVKVTHVGSMYQRLDRFTHYLAASAINDLPQRLAQQQRQIGIDASWQKLSAWLEPVKWYGRLLGQAALAARLQGTEMPKARPYQVHTPLDRLIDFLPVESGVNRALALDIEQRGVEPVLTALVQQWRTLCGGNDCPPELLDQRDRLVRLVDLVDQRLAGHALNAAQRLALGKLCEPQDDFLLAPVFVLKDWLLQR